MRHRETNEPHGIVRGITTDGVISEACWENGALHGFIRTLWDIDIADVIVARHSVYEEYVQLHPDLSIKFR